MILQVNSKYSEKVIKNNFRIYSVECYFFVDLNIICVILTGLCVFLKNICMCQHLINKCKTLKKNHCECGIITFSLYICYLIRPIRCLIPSVSIV